MYETSHDKNLNTHKNHYVGEFHTVAGPLQGDNGERKVQLNTLKK
jgi:hypothetical protein